MKPLVPASILATLALAATPAHAAQTTLSSDAGGTTYAGTNGGAVYGEPVAGREPHAEKKPTPKPKPKSSRSRPVLSQFRVDPRRIYPYGGTPRATFRVDGRAKEVTLRLIVNWPDGSNPPVRVDLGRRPTNTAQTVDLPQLADPALPEGEVRVRITGRDTSKRVLRRGAEASSVQEIEIRGHRFPLRGSFSYGGAGARFGAARSGHTHQGQDLMAAEGTEVVAPRGGTVTYVEYQASGAGWYVILDGEGEDLDYAFMHLQEGSIVVQKGEHVTTGQRLGSVGHTGDAEGDHLHFEIWQGTWFDGGHAVDPWPYLQRWQTWSDVTAT